MNRNTVHNTAFGVERMTPEMHSACIEAARLRAHELREQAIDDAFASASAALRALLQASRACIRRPQGLAA
jgi:hypothetical protein